MRTWWYAQTLSGAPHAHRTRPLETLARRWHGLGAQAHPRPHLAQGRPRPEGPGWVDDAIAEAVEVSQPTVSRGRKQYVEQGLQAALNRRPPTREYVRK